ncbi:MAG: hypothetical protein AABW84_02325 [Nanoarchaeota archaeon]
MVFETASREFLENRNRMLRKSLGEVGRLEAEIKILQTRINLEKRRGNKTQASYYESKLRARKKELNKARIKTIFAEGLKRQ